MNRANSCGLCKASEARDELVAGIMGHVHLRWWEHPARAHLLDLGLRRHKLRPLDKPLIPLTKEAQAARAAFDAAIDAEDFEAQADAYLLN